jgi:hypothetical protein
MEQLIDYFKNKGQAPFVQATDDYQYTLRLTGEGVYTFTATTTDTNNTEYSDSVSIIVQDGQKLDTLLRSKWDEMKAAMRNRDVEGALKNISDLKTDEYREIFTLIQDQLPQMANDMSELELISMRGGLAKYIIKRNELIDGQQYEIAYFVYFSPDPFGNWTIDEF